MRENSPRRTPRPGRSAGSQRRPRPAPVQPQGFNRAAHRGPVCQGKSGITSSGSHGPPSRVTRCRLSVPPRQAGPLRGCVADKPRPGMRGHRQVMAERRGQCVSRRLPCGPPGTATHLPSAGDRPPARRGGKARTGSCDRSSVPFLRGAPAACRPPGPGEPRRAAAAALTSVRREKAAAAAQCPQQAARSSQGRHKGRHLPGAAAARARGVLGNGVPRGCGGARARPMLGVLLPLGHGITGSIRLEKPSEIIESNL